MDELKAFEKLVRQARRESPPRMDVGGAVLSEIRAGRAVRILPLSIMAAVAAVAAVVVMALVVHTLTGGADPQVALFPSLEVGLL
jgi:hypothetical protein